MFKLLLLIVYPAIEIYLLVALGRQIGGFLTVCWVFASAGLGYWVIRSRASACAKEISEELSAGRMPQKAIIDGVLMLIGGFLLLLPGLLCDVVGLLLLISYVRRLFLKPAAHFVHNHQKASSSTARRVSSLFIYDSRSCEYRSVHFEEKEDFLDSDSTKNEPDVASRNEETTFDCIAVETTDTQTDDSKKKAE